MLLSDINGMRLQFAKSLLPEAELVPGDIIDVMNILIDKIKYLVGNNDYMLSMTPPCQGMSINGIRTIMKKQSEGVRPLVDPRNYLIVNCFKIIKATKPKFVFFENVRESETTWLLINGCRLKFTDYLCEQLKSLGYVGECRVLNFADFGVPQNRRRLVGIFELKPNEDRELFPPSTTKKMTLKNAVGHLPELDAGKSGNSKAPYFHYTHTVPKMKDELYHWVSNTKEGRSAFQNDTCINCGYINGEKDIDCGDCKSPLPKPTVIRNGERRLIKGYGTSYRRMVWNKPANTVTTRSAFASSQSNLHPSQNRVLSVYECAILQGLQPEHINWTNVKTRMLHPDYLLREILGEAIPASFTEQVGRNLLGKTRAIKKTNPSQLGLDLFSVV